MLNADLSFADWFSIAHSPPGKGIYGPDPADPRRPAEPGVCAVRPRLITLTPGQPIYRWADSTGDKTPEDRAASPWWSTKRGAMHILLRRRAIGDPSTSESARHYSNVAREWGSDMNVVLCGRVLKPIRCFMGMGSRIEDDLPTTGEIWDSRGLQLYIPNLSAWNEEREVYTLSEEAREHLQIEWLEPASAFELEHWNANMPEGARITG